MTVPDPIPEPEPEPERAPNVIRGTSRNDTLIGTSGSDAICGGGDDDRLTGDGGADFFVFGANARDNDRDRDRDVITDFNAAEDTIVFGLGATLRFVEQVRNNLHIQLNGDRDLIVVQNADIGIVANFDFTDGLFLAQSVPMGRAAVWAARHDRPPRRCPRCLGHSAPPAPACASGRLR